MKHQTAFRRTARIDETTEQEAQSTPARGATPALRLRLLEIVAEYVEKAESLATAIKAFSFAASGTNIPTGYCVYRKP